MPKVSPSPLVSLEPALEALRLASAIRTSRLVLLTMFVPAVAMIPTDIAIGRADPSRIGPLVTIRVLSILLISGALGVLSRVRSARGYEVVVTTSSLLTVGISLLFQWYRPPDSMTISRLHLLMMVGFYVATHANLRWQTTAGVLLGVGSSLMFALRPSAIPAFEIVAYVQTCILANVIGWYLSVQRTKLRTGVDETARQALAHTLRELRVIRGTLAQCSKCRRVGTPEGAWQSLEDYVLAQTDTDFSEALCETCTTAAFPMVTASTKVREVR